VEVEIKLARGVLAEETIDALYAFTDCELSVSPSLVTIEENMPCQLHGRGGAAAQHRTADHQP
jgi:topoisomerase IV subunit A